MLHFFRKYQSYFFVVITVVIIISFSFFGTYNTLPASGLRDQVVFTAVDGTQVKRSELDEMVAFISTDNEDKMLFGGSWGPNFLNNGVIKNDFIMTGLAEVLVANYPNEVRKDLTSRLEKEKRFVTYKHPQAGFLTAESSWNYFAPDMKTQYNALRQSSDPADPQAFAARTGLYLSEKRFPSSLMRRVLQYQEKQYTWLTPDPNLNQIDLSLFGYHTVEDWFGPRFVRLVAEFIINSSKIAEQKGYKVSKEEAYADLMRNAEMSFQQNLNNPHLGVPNSKEYLAEQLRLMGMDQNTAIKIWRQITLSQRLFQDVGNSVFVDSLAFEKINAFAKESIDGDLYRLPPALRLANFAMLQKFEVYLNAISKRTEQDKDLLALPTTFLSVEEVSKKYPELVQKRYFLIISQTSKDNLQTKIGLKDMWNWEVDPTNWKLLVAKFSLLGTKPADTREQRFAALDSLDDAERNRVDAFARNALVDAHPEWLQSALDEADKKELTMGLSTKGGKSYFTGLDNREALMLLLDQTALVGQEPTTQEAKDAAKKLAQFTSNGTLYYRISVVGRLPQKEILTFAEANQQGILDDVLNRQLETFYIQTRATTPTEFQNKDKSWKEFAQIKEDVAKLYFSKLINAIETDYAAAGNKSKALLNGDSAAPLRFYSYVRDLSNKIKKDPKMEAIAVAPASDTESIGKLQASKPLNEQWKLDKALYQADRSSARSDLDPKELFNLPVGDWTAVQTPPNGDLNFFHLKAKGDGRDVTAVLEKTNAAYSLMSSDAQRAYMNVVVEQLKEKHAISLDYLNNPSDGSTEAEMEPEQYRGAAV